MPAESIKVWRIKTGQTTSVMVDVEVLGALAANHPGVEDDLRKALGHPVYGAIADVTRNGIYERKGSGRSLERKKAPDLSGA
jgi:hypothetical protein